MLKRDQMIWSWIQPVRPSWVQFSLEVNQASLTEKPAASNKERAVCEKIIWLLLGGRLRLTSHFWIASIFQSFTRTKVFPASIPAWQ